MQHNFSVFREGDAMAKGLEQLKVIRERLKNARLDDTSSEFNTQRVECLELDNLMETAYATAVSANFGRKAAARIAASISRSVMMPTGCVIPVSAANGIHDAPKRQYGTETASGVPAEDSYLLIAETG